MESDAEDAGAPEGNQVFPGFSSPKDFEKGPGPDENEKEEDGVSSGVLRGPKVHLVKEEAEGSSASREPVSFS